MKPNLSRIPAYILSVAIPARVNVGTRHYDYADGRSVQRPTIFDRAGRTVDYADTWRELLPKLRGAIRRGHVGAAVMV